MQIRTKTPQPTRRAKPAHLIGRDYEARAQRHLEQRGLKIVAKNYRAPYGEIDLVMLDKATLVFVEVRYRNSTRFGGALNSLNHAKRRKIIRSAQHYLMQHKHDGATRFDFVAIEAHNEPMWLRDIFQADQDAF